MSQLPSQNPNLIQINKPIIDQITYNEFGEILIQAHLPDGTDVSRSGGLAIPSPPYALIFNYESKDWAVTNAITPISDGYEIIQIC